MQVDDITEELRSCSPESPLLHIRACLKGDSSLKCSAFSSSLLLPF
jgi:hypothetical protein